MPIGHCPGIKKSNLFSKTRQFCKKKSLSPFPPKKIWAAAAVSSSWKCFSIIKKRYPTQTVGEIQRFVRFHQSLIVPILQVRPLFSSHVTKSDPLQWHCPRSISFKPPCRHLPRAIFHAPNNQSPACDQNRPFWAGHWLRAKLKETHFISKQRRA